MTIKSQVKETAFFLLYILHDYAALLTGSEVEIWENNRSLFRRSSHDLAAYDRALKYLRGNNLINEFWDESDRQYAYINKNGLGFLEDNKNDYVDMSVEAMIVLAYYANNMPDDPFVMIYQNYDIGYNQFIYALNELHQMGYIEENQELLELIGSISEPWVEVISDPVKITRLGLDTFRRNFRCLPSPAIQSPVASVMSSSVAAASETPSINFAGATINAPMQVVGVANGSAFQQTNAERLRREINEIIDKSLKEVVEHVESKQRRILYGIAEELKKEIQKANPDPSAIQKGLAGLSFLSDVGGTVSFGASIFQLIAQNGPNITELASKINLLLQTLPK